MNNKYIKKRLYIPIEYPVEGFYTLSLSNLLGCDLISSTLANECLTCAIITILI